MEKDDFEELTVNSIRNEIIKFKNDVVSQKLDRYYNSKTYSEILGVSRREISHSNFIAWLLNDKENHNLSSYPIMKFLEILVMSSNDDQHEKYKELFDSIIIDDIEVENLEIMTERSIKNVGRVDIYIEAKLRYAKKCQNIRIIVENKVTTKEHSDQTLKYYNYYESLEDDSWENIYVFLTSLSGLELSELTEPECSCKAYIQTNYQNLVDYLLEPILNKNISPKTESIIKDYLQALSQPTQSDYEEEHKQGLIMAIGKEERELLTKFWNQNQKLILSALYAISSDPEQEEDIRDNINSALQSISSSEKDRSLITISYDGVKEVEKIKKSDIGFKTVELLNEKGLIDNELFDFLRKDKTCSFLLLKQKEEMTETEIKYSKYRSKSEPELIHNHKGYYVARNWGKASYKKFIDIMTKKVPKLNYEIHE
jgi:hypothetical protein